MHKLPYFYRPFRPQRDAIPASFSLSFVIPTFPSFTKQAATEPLKSAIHKRHRVADTSSPSLLKVISKPSHSVVVHHSPNNNAGTDNLRRKSTMSNKPNDPTDPLPCVFDLDVEHWIYRECHQPMVQVTRPHEVACYSKYSDGHIEPGARTLLKRYVRPPPTLSCNLFEGVKTFIPKRHESTCITRAVGVILDQNKYALQHSDVITFRNNLNKIGNTVHDRLNQWEVDCCFIDNKLFLDVCLTNDDASMPEALQRGAYAGRKFEAICTGEPNSIIDANPEFCSMATLKLGRHRILLSSEIDCIDGDPTDETDALSKYVELKTIRHPHNERSKVITYKHKYAKFWLQSFLAGVRTVTIGTRRDDGFLESTADVSTEDIVSEAHDFLNSRNSRPWSPILMINFIEYILAAVHQYCLHHKESTIRLYHLTRQRRVRACIIAGPDTGMASKLRPLLSQREKGESS